MPTHVHGLPRNAAEDGLWKVVGRRQVIYAKSTMSLGDQVRAAEALIESRGCQPLKMPLTLHRSDKGMNRNKETVSLSGSALDPRIAECDYRGEGATLSNKIAPV
jgi:hypothetical protein